MSDKVEVDLTSLTTFAKSASGLAAEHADAALTHPQDLYKNTTDMFTAGDDFPEAHMFANYHARLSHSAESMLKDTIAGIESLGSGANYCAVNYADSDEGNAAFQRRVDEALGPSQTNEYVPPNNDHDVVQARKEAINNQQHPVAVPASSDRGN